MTKSFIPELTAEVNDFVAERDWEQFHSPKNLAMAMIVEAAELVEHFQWLTQQESAALDVQKKSAVADELADVLVYLVCLADRLEINLEEAVLLKMRKNRAKSGIVRGVRRRFRHAFKSRSFDAVDEVPPHRGLTALQAPLRCVGPASAVRADRRLSLPTVLLDCRSD